MLAFTRWQIPGTTGAFGKDVLMAWHALKETCFWCRSQPRDSLAATRSRGARLCGESSGGRRPVRSARLLLILALLLMSGLCW